MQSLGRRYVAAFNRRHGRRGPLWEGRFRSSVLDARTLLMDVIAYVEKAPAVEGLAASAAEWPWSSAAHHCGHRRDALVVDHPAYWRLGNTPFEREHAHTIVLWQPLLESERRIEEAVCGGAVIGAADFRARISEATGRPTGPRPRGRPPGKKTVPI
jgi:putative transposase